MHRRRFRHPFQGLAVGDGNKAHTPCGLRAALDVAGLARSRAFLDSALRITVAMFSEKDIRAFDPRFARFRLDA